MIVWEGRSKRAHHWQTGNHELHILSLRILQMRVLISRKRRRLLFLVLLHYYGWGYNLLEFFFIWLILLLLNLWLLTLLCGSTFVIDIERGTIITVVFCQLLQQGVWKTLVFATHVAEWNRVLLVEELTSLVVSGRQRNFIFTDHYAVVGATATVISGVMVVP